jgi:hypothetical protein
LEWYKQRWAANAILKNVSIKAIPTDTQFLRKKLNKDTILLSKIFFTDEGDRKNRKKFSCTDEAIKKNKKKLSCTDEAIEKTLKKLSCTDEAIKAAEFL